MAAMDDLGRTHSALEHKFRAWRQDGKKILAEKGDVGDAKSTPSKAAATPKKTVSVRGGAGEKSTPRKVFSRKLMTAKDAEDEGDETEDDAAADPQLKAEVSLFSTLSMLSRRNADMLHQVKASKHKFPELVSILT